MTRTLSARASLRYAAVPALALALVAGGALMAGQGNSRGSRNAAGNNDSERIDIYSRVGERAGQTMVKISFVMSLPQQMGGEQEWEVTGLLVDGEGLVVANGLLLGGFAAQFGQQANLQDVKIHFPGADNGDQDADQGVDAEVLFRDADRDLAWIRVSEAPDEPTPFIPLATRKPNVEPGQTLYVPAQIDEFFGGGTMVVEVTVAAITQEPRELFIPYVQWDQNPLGLPVFDAGGNLVGMTAVQQPDEEDTEGSQTTRPNTMLGQGALAILPVDQIASATKTMREQLEAQADELEGGDPE